MFHSFADGGRGTSGRAWATVALLGGLVGAATPLAAQTRGTAPVLLLLPGSTRALAMGDANVGLGGDPDAIFYNPSLLQTARGMGLAVQRYGSASTLGTITTAMALAPGAIGIGVRILDYGAASSSLPGGVLGTADDLTERGPEFASNTEVAFGYSRPVIGFRAGLAVKYIEQRTASVRDGAGALDIGISRGSTFVVGAAVQNIGHALSLAGEEFELPRRVTLGIAMPRKLAGPLDLAASSAFSVLRHGDWSGGAGAEAAYSPLDGFTFVARAGVQIVRTDDDQRTHGTFGLAYIGERFGVDYAYQSLADGGSHRFAIRWR